MSSPAPSASAAARGEELYGGESLNIIPPRPAKRLGMPKLQLPSVASISSSTRPAPPKLNTTSGFLHLSIPSRESNALNNETEEGYEGSAGTSNAAIAGGLGTNSNYRSIYPDTVPYGRNGSVPDTYALTNDLRRAIGGLSVEGSGGGEEISGGAASIKASSSASSLETPASTSRTGLGSPSPGTSISSTDRSQGMTVGQELEEESELQLKGNLEVLERLGEGASGEVRKARYKPTGLIMAMKTISTSPNPAIHRQILRELSFNRTCHSDYIVRYFGAYLESEDTSIVICMENCDAGSLDGIYKRCKARNGRMGEKILAKIAESGLRGLEYLHQRKIIHRDIKPSNILVTRQGQIKLCDFGVSGELINSMAGTFTGTSYYMAPERIRGLPYNITSDVWSLGLTILEVASNRFPFPPEGEPALGPIDLLSYIVSMKTPELKDDAASGVKWTKAFKDFLDHCLEKDGTKRYGPVKMLNHPFMKKSIARLPQPNLAKFVAEVWGWPYDDDSACPVIKTRAAPPEDAPLENIDVPGIGRVASLRKAPSPNVSGGLKGQLRVQVSKGSGSPALTEVAEGVSSSEPCSSLDSEGRTAVERAAAKQREAEVGLIGSPTV